MASSSSQFQSQRPVIEYSNTGLPFASIADILRAHDKDVQVLSMLNEHIKSIASLFSQDPQTNRNSSRQSWLKKLIHTVRKNSDFFTQALGVLIFYLCTSLRGWQTPGEEFCSLVQVRHLGEIRPRKLIVQEAKISTSAATTTNATTSTSISTVNQPPSRSAGGQVRPPASQVLVMMVLTALSQSSLPPRILEKIVHIFMDWKFSKNSGVRYRLRHEASKSFTKWLHTIHLALFFLYGHYYQIPKRLSNIRLARISVGSQEQLRSARNASIYYLLGWLLTIQILITALLFIRDLIQRRKKDISSKNASANQGTSVPWILKGLGFEIAEDFSSGDQFSGAENMGDEINQHHSDSKNARSKICSLCLEIMTHPTLTECGHVFCWNCIAGWCTTNELCPLCRQTTRMNKLVTLYNY